MITAGLLAPEVFAAALLISSLPNLSGKADGSLMQKSEERIPLTRSEVTQELHNALSQHTESSSQKTLLSSLSHTGDLTSNN